MALGVAVGVVVDGGELLPDDLLVGVGDHLVGPLGRRCGLAALARSCSKRSTSARRKRRCPPGVTKVEMDPWFAQRRSVAGWMPSAWHAASSESHVVGRGMRRVRHDACPIPFPDVRTPRWYGTRHTGRGRHDGRAAVLLAWSQAARSAQDYAKLHMLKRPNYTHRSPTSQALPCI